jgi:hypothetical protein
LGEPLTSFGSGYPLHHLRRLALRASSARWFRCYPSRCVAQKKAKKFAIWEK